MYIISKYKDYYDGAVGYGIDKTIVYHRHPSNHDVPDDFLTIVREGDSLYSRWNSFTSTYQTPIPNGKYSSDVVILGFCGKLYFAVQFTKSVPSNGFYYDTAHEIVYDVEEIKNRLRPEWEKHNYFTSPKDREIKFDNYVKKISSTDPMKWFREFNTPVFVFGSTGIDPTNAKWQDGFEDCRGGIFITDPLLNDYQFARVFDPYTAFQEIQMFVSGVLPSGDDVEQLPATEKQKVGQHGMDKWSFRRRPNK